VDGETSRLDDTGSGTINTAFLNQAINWGTAKCNFYLLSRYNAIDLAQSWVCNNWAVICTAYWLSTRRGNPPPGSFDDLYKEAIEDMKAVHSGDYSLPEIGLRSQAWPAWSNLRHDLFYTMRKTRVERAAGMSEQTPVPYMGNQDWAGAYIIEPG
jgi:hypothetical protein